MTPQKPTPSASFDLSGRTALVVGAAGGIGRALAQALHDHGADLVLAIEEGQQADVPVPAVVTTLDLGRREGRAERLSALFVEHRIDIVVNAAGRIARGPAAEFPDEDWYDVLELNLNAAFDLARAAGVAMLRQGGGKIINIASLLSFQGGLRTPSYAASKHAIAGLTRALANEWAAHGICVNAIAPGYVETALTGALRGDPERAGEITSRIPAGRWAKPEDLCGAAVFLASPASDYVHGHVLVVDGGWMAR